ncbi:MAG: hypothetical protein QXH40_02845 [Candidatus Bathyarchaeia archaeon]
MNWKNYLIAVILICIIILAVAFVFLNATFYQLQLKILELENQFKKLESKMPKKNYASIPSEAFLPLTNTQTYDKGAGYLKGLGIFFATVQLPDGINITKMSVLVTDESNTGYVYVSLSEHNLTRGVYGVIAEASTSVADAPGRVWLIDDTVYHVIDNKNCAYGVHIYLSENSYSLYVMGVVLEYEYIS